MKNISLVIKTLEKTTNIDTGCIKPENFTAPLTGPIFKLNHRDLLYLFFELEKKSGKKFCLEELKLYQFNTINGICEILAKLAK